MKAGKMGQREAVPRETRDLRESELDDTILFRGVDLAGIRGLLETCPIRKLEKGEILLHAGNPNRNLYLLLSGRLEICLKPNLSPVAVLEPGEVVGEISVFDGRPTTAEVLAREPSRVLIMDSETVWSLVDGAPLIARNLLSILACRLREGDRLISRGQQQELEYVRFSVLDPVTGFYNYRWLEEVLPNHLDHCCKEKLPFMLLVVGLDYFRRYFSDYGPLAADRAVYTVAWVLRQNLRPGELVAHHRKGEFAILMPGVDLPEAEAVAERICAAVLKTDVFDEQGKKLAPVSVSVGIARMQEGETPASFISAGRAVLEAAQRRGAHQVARREAA